MSEAEEVLKNLVDDSARCANAWENGDIEKFKAYAEEVQISIEKAINLLKNQLWRNIKRKK